MPDKRGQQIGNYRLVSLLGSGGFAEVYLGEHVHKHHLRAAIKFLHIKPDRIYQKWFLQEAAAIASLKHPHIMRIIGFGIERADNTPYLIMGYAPGRTLRDRHVRGEHLPLPTVVAYVHQIADALQYAHDRKLIHRDLKPENLLIGANGEIIVSDFGIAAIAQSSTLMHSDISIVATPYSAPEQIQGMPGRESDQYALGIMVYEWLTGKPPFTGNEQTIELRHLGIEPAPLHKLGAGIPPEVEKVVMKALAKKPEQRFARVQEFANAFEQASHVPVPLEPSTKGRRDKERRELLRALTANPRNILLAGLVLILVLLSILGGVGVYIDQHNLAATATATALMRATTTARNATLTATAATALANATATTQAASATATATAQATATATKPTATATATPSANPYGGTLAFSEALSDSGHGSGWPVVSDAFGTCQFLGGAYQVSTTFSGIGHWCDASPDFSNFAFEVQMTILQGDTGGITFRAENALDTRYIFLVGQNGTCELFVAQGSANVKTLVQPALRPAVHQGRRKTNIIAVVARGNTITLYVNHQQIASVTDGTLSQGLIGLVVSSSAPGGYLTQVAYSNARVWTF